MKKELEILNENESKIMIANTAMTIIILGLDQSEAA